MIEFPAERLYMPATTHVLRGARGLTLLLFVISVGCQNESGQPPVDPAGKELNELKSMLDGYSTGVVELEHRIDRLRHESLTVATEYVIAREDDDGSLGAQNRITRRGEELAEIVTTERRETTRLERLREWMTEREAELRQLERQHKHMDGMDEELVARYRTHVSDKPWFLRDAFNPDAIWVDDRIEAVIEQAREGKHRLVPKPPRVALDGVELDVHYAVSLAFNIWDFEKKLRNLKHDFERFNQSRRLEDLANKARGRIDTVERELAVLASLYHRRIGLLSEYDSRAWEDAIKRYTEQLGSNDDIRRGLLAGHIPRHIGMFTNEGDARIEQVNRWRTDLAATRLSSLP